jgi:regulatory protein
MATTEYNQLYESAKQKAIHYCSYQERTTAEVDKKLADWGLEPINREKLIQELQGARLLDEQRYIESFIRGRFVNKKWGKRKIYYELLKKQLNPVDIQRGLQHIEEADYLQTLGQLVIQKHKSLTTVQPALARQKITAYLLQKGYESDLIQQVMQSNL